MSKREELRNYIFKKIRDSKYSDRTDSLSTTDEILSYLDSQGVVIKKESTSDDIHLPILKETWEGMLEDIEMMGYTLTERLVSDNNTAAELHTSNQPKGRGSNLL